MGVVDGIGIFKEVFIVEVDVWVEIGVIKVFVNVYVIVLIGLVFRI